jgi:hypothetical protein
VAAGHHRQQGACGDAGRGWQARWHRLRGAPAFTAAAPLALLLAALWPHLAWIARRLTDGSDEPWGILALATVLTVGGLALAQDDEPASPPPLVFDDPPADPVATPPVEEPPPAPGEGFGGNRVNQALSLRATYWKKRWSSCLSRSLNALVKRASTFILGSVVLK